MSKYDELSSLLGIGIMVSNHSYATKLVKSMKNLLPYLSKVKVSMVINGRDYENPDNLSDLIKLVPDGIDYDIVGPISYDEVRRNYYSKGKNPSLKFLKLRQLSVSKCLDRKYWFIMDDDMTFGGPTDNQVSAGLMILRMIEYMERMPSCGVISGGSSLIRKIKPYEISISLKPGWMARGLLIRNVDGLVCDKNLIDSAGGGEDEILWMDKIYKNYYPAIIPNFRVKHYCDIPKPSKQCITKGWHTEYVRQDPDYGAEYLMKKFYDIDLNYNKQSYSEWSKRIYDYIYNKFKVDNYDAAYTLDLSYIK